MKKKLLGIFVCMLVIATAIPAVGTLDEKTMTSTGRIELVPVVDFINIKGGLLGISVLLMNFGEGTAHDMTWSMTVSGGLLFFPREANGEIPSPLDPDDEYVIPINLLLGLGKSTVTFYCNYTIILDLSRSELEVGVKQEWSDLGLLILHTFPQGIQPEKEWVEIDGYEYIETDDQEVELTYAGINNMHNVRVVLGKSYSPDIEFLASCKFQNGTGYLKENWITKDIVTGGDAHWEVELVNGM
jgi:hypothetical protein